jgi:hypothetical protein
MVWGIVLEGVPREYGFVSVQYFETIVACDWDGL